MDLRKHPRFNTSGIEVGISDRVGFSTGIIKNVSHFGLCITDITRRIQSKDKLITLTIPDSRNRFKLQVIPKWQEQSGHTMIMGVTIEKQSWLFTEMTMRLEPKNEYELEQ